MSKEIRLQDRDIRLLIFLGSYKTISLDNTKYIYNTVTYQEKRIVALVKHNYIRRLKHRYIALGPKGKEYLAENSYEIVKHCRNEHNLERLAVISDIASCLIRGKFNFTPSWDMKNIDEPTSHSRRYIGNLEHYYDNYLVYAVYEGKDDKYIKSIYYDIRKEHDYDRIMVFTNNIEKIVFFKKGFYNGNKESLLVPYNNDGKYIIRHYFDLTRSIYERLKEKYNAEITDFRFADLQLDEDNYVVIMPLVDTERLARLSSYYYCNKPPKGIHIFGQAENEEIVKKYLPKCNYCGLTIQRIKELVEEYERKYNIRIDHNGDIFYGEFRLY